MPLPLAHGLVGASVSIALWPTATPAARRRAAIVGAALGVCPDLDFALGWFHVLGWRWHHGPTHSIAFALVIGLVVAWASGARRVLPCIVAVLSHPVLDFLITESPGVALWWPITDHRYKLGIAAVSYYHLTAASDGALAFVKLGVVELVVFGPWLVLAVLVRSRSRRCRDDAARHP